MATTGSGGFHARHPRRAACAALLFAGVLAAGPAQAEGDTSLDDSAKKVGNNFGEMLKGMGQELKKAGGSLTDPGKKNHKKDKQRPEDASDKDRGR